MTRDRAVPPLLERGTPAGKSGPRVDSTVTNERPATRALVSVEYARAAPDAVLNPDARPVVMIGEHHRVEMTPPLAPVRGSTAQRPARDHAQRAVPMTRVTLAQFADREPTTETRAIDARVCRHEVVVPVLGPQSATTDRDEPLAPVQNDAPAI